MVKTSKLLNGVVATAAIGDAVPFIKTTRSRKSFLANGVTTAGAGSATVLVEASNDGGLSWITVATLTLTTATTLAAGVHAGYATDAAYEMFRLRVTAIAGTNCAVNGWSAN